MKKLFENVNGNQFKLITESITEIIQGSELVREGLKKIFSNGSKEISYQRLAGVGMGYIKDITIARKCALQESHDLAPSYGYIPNDNEQKFVKEVFGNTSTSTAYGPAKPRPPKADISQKNMEEPEDDGEISDYDRETPSEIQIGKSILAHAQKIRIQGYDQHSMASIEELAQKLIKMHGDKPPYSGSPIFTGGGHGGL